MNYYAFLRVSSSRQNNEKFLLELDKFALSHSIQYRRIVKEKASGRKPWRKRKIGSLLYSMQSGDYLVTPELSRLGRSMFDLMEISNYCLSNNITIFAIKNNLTISDNMQSKIFLTVFSLAAEIEVEMLSLRVKEALMNARLKGIRLGRPPGSLNSCLDKKAKLIDLMLDKGMNAYSIGKNLGFSTNHIKYWLRTRRNITIVD